MRPQRPDRMTSKTAFRRCKLAHDHPLTDRPPYPERRDLAVALRRLLELGWPIGGASDHGTHEAIYLADADGNGIELAWDRAEAEWPRQGGRLAFVSRPLDFDGLLAEADAIEAGAGAGAGVGAGFTPAG